jgi:hypothetical protein
MKKLILMVMLAAAAVYADVPSFGDVKLRMYFDHAPTYRTVRGGVVSGGGILDNEQYLVIEAVFRPGAADEASVEKAAKNRTAPATKAWPGMWVDNVRMKTLVAYPEIVGRNRKESVYGLFSGSTTFWSISLDGKEHTATMFVPPHLISRYAGFSRRSPRKQDGKTPARNAYKLSTKDFFAEVVFTTAKGLELGRAYCHVDGMRTNDDGNLYFRRVEKRVGSRIINGAVQPRSRSPWAFINPERYDLIRSDGGYIQDK